MRNGPPAVLLRRGREFQRRLAPRAVPFGGQGAYAQFISPDGDVLRPPGGGQDLPVSAEARALAREGGDAKLTDATVDGTHVRVLTSPQPGGGAVQVARSLDEVDSQLHRILVALIVVGAVGIALGGALGAVVARTALVPIGRFTARTERLRQDADLTERMEVVGDDELARLARSYNATLDALERSAEAQRHLVADASHELRTPIASLRANIQMLSDADRLPPGEREQMQADIVGELDELTSLVGDVVELARGSKPASRQDDVRLDEVVAAVVEREAPARTRRRPWRRRGSRRRWCAASRTGSRGPSRTWSATPSSGAPTAARSRSAWTTACCRCATTAPASRRPTCRTCSSASTAPRPPAAPPARGWGWPSWPRPPRRTGASPRRPTPTAGERSCGSASGPCWRRSYAVAKRFSVASGLTPSRYSFQMRK